MLRRTDRSLTSTEHRRLLPFLGALSLFLSTVEYLFPKPVPFFRLGLANLPLLVGLDTFSFRELALLLALKVAGQALVNGTLASYVFLFSLAGSTASFFVMVGLHRLARRFPSIRRRSSLVSLGLAGALASNTVQILLSIQFIFGPTSLVIAPLFYGLGTGSGLAVGLLAQTFTQRSHWWKKVAYGAS